MDYKFDNQFMLIEITIYYIILMFLRELFIVGSYKNTFYVRRKGSVLIINEQS